MKEVVLTLTGTMPLLMHNERLVNPLNEHAREIKKITSKRTKTEDDYKEIERLEWFGGIYADDTGPVFPTANVRKCLINAGKVRKLGTAVARSVYTRGISVPLLYDGPRDLKELWKLPRFRDVRACGVNSSRVMRCRPHFPEWQIQLPLLIVTESLNFEDFEQIASLAGKIEGIGDGRSIGFGRFEVEIGGAK